jgi:hypothetical protein
MKTRIAARHAFCVVRCLVSSPQIYVWGIIGSSYFILHPLSFIL